MNVVVFIKYYFILVVNKVVTVISDDGPFTINTEGCKIPKYPNSDKTVKDMHILLNRWLDQSKCSDSIRLVSSNSSHIWINEDAYEDFNIYIRNEFYCCYAYFLAENNIASIKYGNCTKFTAIIKAEHEFVRTECFYFDNKIYDDFFMFNVHNKHYNQKNTGYNVLVLGIESMSRLNFQRTMPLTAKFLKDRGSIQMLGYNKLGDNSFPNLFPVLMGKSFKAARDDCIINNITDIDKCPFIWDIYKRAGFTTILGSDSIAGLLGTYEYELAKTPTDFYLQPFVFETGKLYNNNYLFHVCFNNRYLYKVLLDYIKGITNYLRSTIWFGMFWEESVSHDLLYLPKIMDNDYVQFLNNLNLNETVLIFLSDHGMRFGEIVKTKYGRQEERLPLLEVLFPKRFQNQFQEAFKNFQSNSQRLTTPYDLYETLLDLLSRERIVDNHITMRIKLVDSHTKPSSLFLPISKKRTCDSIGIEDHWCTCLRGQEIKTGDKMGLSAARYVVSYLNKLLSVYSQCHKLSLKQIINVNAVKSNSNKGKLFVVVIKTTPGDGVFDSTLYYMRREWAVSGIVSRLNVYQNQSTCVGGGLIKMYCYCTS